MPAELFILKRSDSLVNNQSRYPSLDGFRAIAIIMVLLQHFGINPVNIFGILGVNIFFIISGFLITSICLKEVSQTEGLSLKQFYLRRVLRIIPLLVLYLVVLYIFNKVYHFNIIDLNFVESLFFLLDFSYFRTHGFTWYTCHLWSLAIEEQFYLFVPFILKFSYKYFVGFILFLVIGLPLVCLLQSYWPAINNGIPYYITHFLIKFQAIGMGCLLAILVFNGYLVYNIKPLLKLMLNIGAIALMLWINYDSFYSINAVFKDMFVCMLIGFVITNNLSTGSDLFYKLLNSTVFTFIGVISYSLYMWNPLFASFNPSLPFIMRAAPWDWLCVIVVSILSYYFYEKRFLLLKPRHKHRPD